MPTEPAEHAAGRSNREEQLAAAFVELADTLVADFDVMDFLHTLTERAVSLLPVDAAGVVLLDARGRMVDASASDERTRHLELAQIEWEEGPCRDCTRTGSAVPYVALTSAEARDRWPRFTGWAVERGFAGVAGMPLRLRERTVGALNLFRERPGAPGEAELHLGQALADVATIGILQYRTIRDQGVINAQLEDALVSRIVIEQAKGMLAERLGLDLDESFARLRSQARRRRMLLTELARSVIDGSAASGMFDEPPPRS
ncbi:transcriptional regulator [Streptomyces sp. Ru73]|uniref:GAF and ANTAR domain-containing protein n=1 Tax=Streptomyces sp. Ru73 TaxID=2080748 RepID=UPI000CDD6927|nr:GAF and ANTAR domain-containing protein [Streptomyces sp. Ru73]POX36427.1 transcriptional regulator [Streptomyces sp. Ru73]